MLPAKKFDVLGLGAAAVDDFIEVETYPGPDSKAPVLGRRRHCGGLTAIALVAAARLGGKCAYAGVLGQDELSRFVLDSMKEEKIDVSWVRQRSFARTVYSNIIVDKRRGTRTVLFDEAGVVGAGVDVPAKPILSCRVLFVDNLGVPGMLRAARVARRAGIPVVADFESDSHPRFPELLRLANHLIVSRDFATTLTGSRSPQKAVRALSRSDREVTAVTCGSEGCWYMARGWKAPKHQRAFRVKAVDTTGCGDVFHGAYAFALARGLPLEERLRLASGAAALKASRGGGLDGIPSMQLIRKFLKHEINDAKS
jgi:ribokinase